MFPFSNNAVGRSASLTLLIALLLLAKGVFMGLYVTPLDFVPDERAHYAYALKLASGDGVPKIGEDAVPGSILVDPPPLGTDLSSEAWTVDGELKGATGNWAAQHPPAYYMVAAGAIRIAALFSDDPADLVRAPRMVSAVSYALVFLLLVATLRAAAVEHWTSVSVALGFSSLPTVSLLAGGTNHDMFLLAAASAATLCFVLAVRDQSARYALLAAAALALASATKMTAWILAGCLIVALLLEAPAVRRRLIQVGVIVPIVAFSTPLLWMLRNYRLYGDPLRVAGDHQERLMTAEPVAFTTFLAEQPVFEQFFLHFYGLTGWRGERMMLQADGLPRHFFATVIAIITVLAVAFILWRVIAAIRGTNWSHHKELVIDWLAYPLRRRFVAWPLIAAAVAVGGYLAVNAFLVSYRLPGFFGGLRTAVIAASLFLAVTSVVLVFFETRWRYRLVYYALGTFGVFGALLMSQIYISFVAYEWLRGIHGRYFLPVVPLLLLTVGILLMRWRIPAVLSLIVALGLLAMEASVLVEQYVPHYYSRGGYEGL